MSQIPHWACAMERKVVDDSTLDGPRFSPGRIHSVTCALCFESVDPMDLPDDSCCPCCGNPESMREISSRGGHIKRVPVVKLLRDLLREWTLGRLLR